MTTRWNTGDVGGTIVVPGHEDIAWGHLSSNEGWLIHDLVDTFPDRREKLKATFPDGFQVVFVDLTEEGATLPPEIAMYFEKRLEQNGETAAA
jgi:hypothetical protein